MNHVINDEIETAIGRGLRSWAAEFDGADEVAVRATLAGACGQLLLRHGPLKVAADLRELADAFEATDRKGMS